LHFLRFAKNFRAFGAFPKNLTCSRAFIKNSALSWKSLRLLRFLQKPRANQPAALLSYPIFFMIFACENLS
jgi:hypothetical protein